MNCPKCHGTGFTQLKTVDFPKGAFCNPQMNCPECHGSGKGHCCDGDREQPYVMPPCDVER